MDREDILKELVGKTMITLTDFFTGAALALNADDIKASAHKVSAMPKSGGSMHDYMGHVEKFRNAANRESMRDDELRGGIASMRSFLRDYLETEFLADERITLRPLVTDYGRDSIALASRLLKYNDMLETRLRGSDAMCSRISVEGENHARYVDESPDEIYEKVIEAKAQTMARALKYAGLEK